MKQDSGQIYFLTLSKIFNSSFNKMEFFSYQSVPNFSFTAQDQKASSKLNQLRLQARNNLPPEHRSNLIITLHDQIRSTKLYEALKTLPKGVLHHVHFDCCEDQEFYKQHIVTDPVVYLSKDKDSFKIGCKKEAEQNGWVSMQNLRNQFKTEGQFIKFVSNLTMLNKQQLEKMATLDSKICWQLFQKKVCTMFPLLGVEHILKKYCIHIMKKYIRNGYDRLQIRSFISGVNLYNKDGEIIKQNGEDRFLQIIDEAYQIVKSQNPLFTIGFIFFGLKMFSPQENIKILSSTLEKKWDKTIGIDFVQQQDRFGSQAPYDQVANKILQRFPDSDLKKVFHSGQSNDHLNFNVQVSINGGSVRIGHGINVVQHPELLAISRKKGICFEQCPVSNIVLGYVKDPRSATSQLLVRLGVPVTLNPDDPARFGYEDTTLDYFYTYISSNWSLRELKLVGIYSINHSICSEAKKAIITSEFNRKWSEWIAKFLVEY